MYVFLVVTRKQQVYCRRLTRDYSIPTQTVMEEQEKIMNSDKVSSTASEGRKNSKPIMEKRRRARINASLAELKSLLLEVMKSEGTRQNKMEKADILELTVRHLRQLQHQQFSALTSTDPAVINKYRLGFNECASEVSKFLGNMNGLDADIRARLLNHLANCTINPDSERSKNIQSPNVKDEQRNPTSPLRCPPSFDGVRIRNDSGTPIVINQELIYGPNNNLQQAIIRPKSNDTQQSVTKIDDKPTHANTTINSPLKNVHVPSSNGNEIEASTQPLQIAKVFGGFQAIPTKMPSGEMAFIIPAANMMSCNNFPNYVIPVIQPQSSVQINNQQTTLGQTLQHVSPVQVTYSVNNVAAPLPAQPMLSSMAGNIAAQPVLSTGFVGNITSHPTVTFQHQSPILINQFSSAEKINTTSQLSLPSLVSSAFSSIKDISVNRERTSPEQNSPVDASHRSVSSTGASSTFTLPNECNKLDPMWRPW